jgi:5-formyltetrahydrofolate cyclo-ligase
VRRGRYLGRVDVHEQKASLRSGVVRARAGLSAEERAAAGRAIRDSVLSRPELAMAGTVAAYYSVGTEPPTRGLVFGLWKRGTYVVLPVLREDGDLDWASYEGPESMVAGPRGLLEPGEARRGVQAVARADAVLVPALAVDRAGNRLGRGGGSFDRALARVGPLVPLIALLYDDELVGALPTAPHDVPVRAVVRPGHGLTALPA